ncbi:hypothetical protein RHSIM_Rhsim11G0069700 [Rhododendron simsii]|uniref:AAA+ ATPase domain-containing protein n=1 Tax=Rhododendron simsii TaxID=118357 RepID=A0A834LAP3_RHOSS|nr:hypothetical protein RHSIM_Rhsim11G0069700 [Rhododendron simsii]
MAEGVTIMDIDDNNHGDNISLKPSYNKSKNVDAPTDTKATPWVEKYRPQSLADVAAHRDIVDTIDRLTSENKLPHLLLYGPPGTGKTSTILAVARKLYGTQMHNMVLELNASDERGIDVVRQQIQDFASTQSFSFGPKSSVKLVLLDEADAMTKDAQFALRRVIEKYTKNTRFALICNHVNKIIPALQSRCTRFRFAPLDAIHVSERLKHVIQAEGLDVSESGLAALVRLCNGDMRKALNILQSTHMASQQLITEEAVYLCTGNPLPKDIEQISHWLLNEAFTVSFRRISELKTRKGLALVDIAREVTMFVFRIKMPPDVRVQLINDLADIEYTKVSGERVQFHLIAKGYRNLHLSVGDVVGQLLMKSWRASVSCPCLLHDLNFVSSCFVMFLYFASAPYEMHRYRLSFGCNDKLQLGSLISTFTQARAALVAAAK